MSSFYPHLRSKRPAAQVTINGLDRVLVVATVLTSYGLVLKNAYHFYVPLSIYQNMLYSIVIHNALTKVILNRVNGFLIFILRTYKTYELDKLVTCVELSGKF